MTILALKKVTLFGPVAEKDEVIAGVQILGCLHLISLTPTPKEPEKAISPRAEQALKALRYLQSTPRKRRQVRRPPDFDLERVVARVIRNQWQLRETSDRLDFLKQRVHNLGPWGDFQLPQQEDLLGHLLWFYVIPVNQLVALQSVELPWQIVHRDSRMAYVVVICREEPPHDLLPVLRTHTGAQSLSDLLLELDQTELAIEEVQAEREGLTRWLYLLQTNLDRAEDQAAMQHAQAQALQRDGLFAVQGWIPVRDLPTLEQFAAFQGLALLVEPVTEQDQPPTLYDNPASLAAGETLVDFYQTPGYRTWDPSILVFGSFALFFAMILADAGYALVLGLLLGWRWRAMGSARTGKRLRHLCLVVVGLSIGYGVLVGSYFGVTPAEGTLGHHLHVLDMQDFNWMMRFSILVGVIHIALANIALIRSQERWRDGLPSMGWIIVMTGGLTIWFSGAAGTGVYCGWTVLALGLSLVLFFSDKRHLDSPLAVMQRVGNGLLALTNLSKMFGDLLSYMRLFALGLASASLALTFNQLAGQVQQAIPGLGFFLSLLILLLGHALNLALSVMSGVVHGLRLNFIEFYSWGILEEGYPFKPFLKKEKSHG